MKIATAAARPVAVPLARPYAIHGHTFDTVDLVLLELRAADGTRGFGQAAPAPEVTGETCAQTLADLEAAASGWLLGRDPRDLQLVAEAAARGRGAAARAPPPHALCDLVGRAERTPCVERFGRVHTTLPTSITIGCKPLAETLAEAEEYRARGFVALKVKIGADVADDLERLRALRQRHGRAITLRADANQGLDERTLPRLLAGSADLDLELIEQPLPPGGEAFLRSLPAAARRLLCADESVLGAEDLRCLLADGCPFGSVNIKLMKCGGPRPALALARLCHEHGIQVMWGCNDESALGIAAALHAALAAPATRWLDLDGSLDLARDPFAGGFALASGWMTTLPHPGFGAEPVAAG